MLSNLDITLTKLYLITFVNNIEYKSIQYERRDHYASDLFRFVGNVNKLVTLL